MNTGPVAKPVVGIIQYILVLGFLMVSLINPHDYFTWILEVFWIIIALGILVFLSRKKTYPTPLLSWAMLAHAYILIYGAWYT